MYVNTIEFPRIHFCEYSYSMPCYKITYLKIETGGTVIIIKETIDTSNIVVLCKCVQDNCVVENDLFL